jgi:hypothetical protein
LGPLSNAARPADGDLAVAFLYGWSAPQEKGRWSDGHLASLALSHAEGPAPSALRLCLQTLPAPSLGPQTVNLSSGFRHIGELHWDPDGAGPSAHMLDVPASAWRGGTMVLRFAIGRPVAPAAIGLGPDPRALGVFLETVSAVPRSADLLSQPLTLHEPAVLPFLWHGWSAPEPIGTWTFGKRSVIRWRTSAPVPAGCRLLVAIGARAPGGETLSGRFGFDGRSVSRFAYPAAAALATTVALALPRPYRAGETMSFTIDVDNPVSPAQLAGGGDARPLGLLVERLQIVQG